MDALMPYNPLWTPGPAANVSVHALLGVGCQPSAGHMLASQLLSHQEPQVPVLVPGLAAD